MHRAPSLVSAPEKRKSFHARVIASEGMLLDCAERLAPEHPMKRALLDACGTTTWHAVRGTWNMDAESSTE
jgi:hypothetical protein